MKTLLVTRNPLDVLEPATEGVQRRASSAHATNAPETAHPADVLVDNLSRVFSLLIAGVERIEPPEGSGFPHAGARIRVHQGAFQALDLVAVEHAIRDAGPDGDAGAAVARLPRNEAEARERAGDPLVKAAGSAVSHLRTALHLIGRGASDDRGKGIFALDALVAGAIGGTFAAQIHPDAKAHAVATVLGERANAVVTPFDGDTPIAASGWLNTFIHELYANVQAIREHLVKPSPLVAARVAWAVVREYVQSAGDRSDPTLALIVQSWLEAEGTTDPDCREARADDALTEAVCAHLSRIRDACGFDADPPTSDADALATDDGMLRADARFAAYLDGIGARGVAETVRAKSRERAAEPAGASRWRLWADVRADWIGARFVHTLAAALWSVEVRARLAEARHKPSALVVPVMREVTDFHSRGRMFDGKQLTFSGREVARLVTEAGNVAPVDLDVLQRGLGLLGSKLSHDVLRHEVFEAHRRVLRGETYPNVLDIEGGWSGFADLLGYSPKKSAVDVRNIVYAQAHFRFAFPDGSHGNMLAYTERAAIGRGGRAHVTLTLGAPLLPFYVHELREKMGTAGILARQAQRLVPMPRHLPPFYGRPNEHGQQASFALALVTELRERSTELAELGSVYLPHDRLTALADRVSLPRPLIVPVLEHWTRDVGDAPAFLRRVEADRYTLGPEHAAELAFIVEAGRRELVGAEGGKAAARRRTADAPKRRRRKAAG